MKTLVAKFGVHIVTAFIIMIIGVLLFILTPLFYGVFNFDSDIFGVLVFLAGFVLFIVGLIVKLIKGKRNT